MADSNEPLTALLTSKFAFDGTSEAIELAELTDSVLPKGNVSWLEVGAGDGSNLAFHLDRLRIERVIDAVAIEPAAIMPPAQLDVEWLKIRAEDYAAGRKFDWINVRHSAYYLNDAIGELTRFTRMLRKGGTLALTHWSRECILHRIHREVSGDSTLACSGIEEVAAQLSRDPGLSVSAPMFIESRLDVARLLNDRPLRDALLVLTLRARPAAPRLTGPSVDVLASLLRRLASPEIRRNGIVLVRALGS